jgi:hypothetical protein
MPGLPHIAAAARAHDGTGCARAQESRVRPYSPALVPDGAWGSSPGWSLARSDSPLA